MPYIPIEAKPMPSQPGQKARITFEVDSEDQHYKWRFTCSTANLTKRFALGLSSITAEFGNVTDETIEHLDRTTNETSTSPHP